LSPEGGTQRRASAIWKGNPDDDTAFRNEILSQFIPKEDDPWMTWESQLLPQFTRIFPKLPTKETDLPEEDEEAKEEGVKFIFGVKAKEFHGKEKVEKLWQEKSLLNNYREGFIVNLPKFIPSP
jgi:hypothetical protein